MATARTPRITGAFHGAMPSRRPAGSALQPPLQRALYETIKARDAAFYDALRATGFLIDFGPDETGLMLKAFRTGSGYYIDVGGSQLIIDGDIKVKSGVEIAALTERGVRFADGAMIEADVIIQATGFRSLHETIGQIVSPEVGERIGRCWGLGSGTRNDPGPWQGEPRNMYKPVAHPNLWIQFKGGNLALSRIFSKFVAMQIKRGWRAWRPRFTERRIDQCEPRAAVD